MRYASTAIRHGRETAVVVLPLPAVPGFDPASPHPGTYGAPDEVDVGWVRDDQSPSGWAPPTPEWVQERLAAAVQGLLDDFARTRGYDGILAACTYAASREPAWAAEAAHCAALRDATWEAFHAALGSQPDATLADLLALLPPLEWPPDA